MYSKRWQTFAGIALIVVATSATAFSLGRVRGTALVGRNLDLSVLANLETSESMPEASCFAAEVFYGESRIAPNAVSVNAERSSSGELRIRVRSSTIVDEPVVTLFVRVGCSAAVSRRYVLLAETVSEAESDAGFIPRVSLANTREMSPVPLAAPRIAFGGASSAGTDGKASRAQRDDQRQGAKQGRQERAEKRASDRADKRTKLEQAPALVESTAQSARALTGNVPPSKTQASIMRKSAQPSKARLQIDLLDLTNTSLGLRGSSELASAPSTDDATRARAQALWRTLNASPDDAMRDALRLATLDSQLLATQDQSKRQSQELAVLSSELQAAQKARYLNPLTLALGVLAFVALALSAVMWLRHRNSVVNTTTGTSTGSGQWWRTRNAKEEPKDEQHLWKHLSDGSDSLLQPLAESDKSGFSSDSMSPTGSASAAQSDASSSEAVQRSGLTSTSQSGPARFSGQSNQLVNLKRSASKVLPSNKAAGAGQKGRVNDMPIADRNGAVSNNNFSNKSTNNDFEPGALNSGLSAFGALGGARVVAAEELFDIQEQADFFLSLGQPEQAIEVLKNHITENVETSALAYMDLFDIYHRTKRSIEYAELREEFNRVFNAQVPEFAAYGEQSKGLEDFPQVLLPIQAAWGQPREVQDVIEESIFRQPEQDQTLDMGAYRELMLLYALAKELSRSDATYNMLPVSMKTSALTGLLPEPDSANTGSGNDSVFSSPMNDLLSPEDRTVSLSHPLFASNPLKANNDSVLDFDLSDSAPVSTTKPMGKKK
jgi:pilus assembly protein FimV